MSHRDHLCADIGKDMVERGGLSRGERHWNWKGGTRRNYSPWPQPVAVMTEFPVVCDACDEGRCGACDGTVAIGDGTIYLCECGHRNPPEVGRRERGLSDPAL